jgi:NAD(P)-dependent dehydrogenase (short-subunit alcohol dehydrogenase family)
VCLTIPSTLGSIGAVAAFLASSDSSFMTASEVAVDGGIAQI